MSSRQEEKEQRKAERLERERAAQADAKKRRMLQIFGGVVVAAAIVVAVVLVVAGGGGSDRPSVQTLQKAATAAGCTYREFPDEGRNHVTTLRTPKNYKTNPPTSGDHNPNPAQDGDYPAGNEPPLANWLHTLEHGRVLLQYRQGSSSATVGALQALFKQPVLSSGASYHLALMQNNTKMPFQTAAVAWRHYLGCKDASPKAIKALQIFRDRFVDKGPELIP